MVNRLCSLYGEQLEVEVENERQTFYNFPTLEQLYAHESNMETTLRAQVIFACKISKNFDFAFSEGFGYRAAYIASTTRKLHALGGRKWLEDLIKVDYEGEQIIFARFNKEFWLQYFRSARIVAQRASRRRTKGWRSENCYQKCIDSAGCGLHLFNGCKRLI